MLAAPWEKFEDEPTSLRWRMGAGEDYMDQWLSYWFGIDEDARRAYLESHPPPPAWKKWLSVVTLGGPVRPRPLRTKYRS